MRKLRISLQIEFFGKIFHERDLASLLPHTNLANLLNPNGYTWLELQGCPSVTFEQQKLLDSDCWFELNYHFIQWPPSKNGNVLDIFFSRGSALSVRQHTRGVVFSFMKDGEKSNSILIPSHEFVREWVLMQHRVYRIRQELGDANILIDKNDWEKYLHATDETIELVGKKYFQYTLTEDLKSVLDDPVPEYL